ncbi:MAG: YHS domain-containing protein [Polyangiaceae bacterium]|nr:YHS domain-containing protein [Polyangiaceae bacterium]
MSPAPEAALAFAFVDLAGFTALTEAHGDASAAGVAERFYGLCEHALVGDTRVVKHIGDAVMLVSTSPEAMARTLLALAAQIDAVPEFPGFRAGFHTGPAVERGGDYFGAAVNLASRVAAHARSGQILCTRPVATALEAAGLGTCAPSGVARFKNVAEAVEVLVLERAPASTSGEELDPVCRMRIDRASAPATLPYAGRTWAFCSFECAQRFAREPEAYATMT